MKGAVEGRRGRCVAVACEASDTSACEVGNYACSRHIAHVVAAARTQVEAARSVETDLNAGRGDSSDETPRLHTARTMVGLLSRVDVPAMPLVVKVPPPTIVTAAFPGASFWTRPLVHVVTIK